MFRPAHALVALVFLGSAAGGLAETVSGEDGPPTLDALTTGFLDGMDAFDDEAIAALDAEIEAALPGADPDSVMLASGRLGPLVKAIVAVETADGVLERARYRIRYGFTYVEAPPAADPLKVSFVQVDRFNLGPALHESLIEAHGEKYIAPAEAFGLGPHVSWRFVMRAVMGHAAGFVAVARAEITDEDAREMACLGVSCLTVTGGASDAAPWGEMEEIERANGETDEQPVYEAMRGGVPTPAAVTDMLAADLVMEMREGLGPTEPFAEIIIETNMGQDSSIDAALRDGHMMDDSVAAIWRRIAAVVQGPDMPPYIAGAIAYECWRTPGFAAPGEYCP
jgi:hypothetical protein